jgi:hypothetical protein
MITFPFWFKVLITFGIIFITHTSYILFNKDKYIDKYIKQLSSDKIDKKIKAVSKIIKVLKFLFWAAPLYLILIPYIFYTYLSSDKFIQYFVMMIITYILLIETFLIDKSMLLNLNKVNK